MAFIVSIQQFSIALSSAQNSNTATISSVTTANSYANSNGFITNQTATGSFKGICNRPELTNATTVTVYRGGNNSDTLTAKGAVIELHSSQVNSIQTGSIAQTGTSSSTTGAISTVGALAFITRLGETTTDSGFGKALSGASTAVALTTTSQVTAYKGSTIFGMAVTSYFAVIDPASTLITSVQKVKHTLASSSTTFTDTISSVTVNNTSILWNGVTSTSVDDAPANFTGTLTVTNATTISYARGGTGAESFDTYYTVLEYATGVLKQAIQRGTIAIGSGSTSNTATITSVNTTNAFVNFTGFKSGNAGTDTIFTTVALTNGTTVTASTNTAGGSPTGAFEAIEFSTSNSFSDTITETVTETDSRTIIATDSVSVSETATASDSASAIRSASVTLSENTTLTDSYTATIPYSASFTETVTPTDISIILATGKPLQTETATVTDTDIAALSASVTLSETDTLSDSYTSAPTYSHILTETVTPTDSTSISSSGTPNLSETSTVIDSISGAATGITNLNETGSVTDQHLGIASGVGVFTETETESDSYNATQTQPGDNAVTETITETDVNSALATANISLSEQVAANDNYDSQVIPFPTPSTEPVSVPGPSDGKWDNYLKWLKKKKRKQFKDKALQQGIPEQTVENVINAAAVEALEALPEFSPITVDYSIDESEVRNIAQKTILAIYDRIWEEQIEVLVAAKHEALKEEEEEEEFFMTMMM